MRDMFHKDFYRVVVRKNVRCSSWSSTSPSQSCPSVPEEYPIHAGSNAGCRLKGPKEGGDSIGIVQVIGHKGREIE